MHVSVRDYGACVSTVRLFLRPYPVPSVGLQTIDEGEECQIAASELGYEIHGGVMPGPKVMINICACTVCSHFALAFAACTHRL